MEAKVHTYLTIAMHINDMYKYSHLNIPKSVGYISGLHGPFEYSTFPRLAIVI